MCDVEQKWRAKSCSLKIWIFFVFFSLRLQKNAPLFQLFFFTSFFRFFFSLFVGRTTYDHKQFCWNIFLARYFWFDFLLLFVVCLFLLDTNLFPNKYPHFSSAYDDTSKQVLVPKRGKKKYQQFLYPVNYLNQRKSPSAPLVSQEIETDF